jgi:hypothetical protein
MRTILPYEAFKFTQIDFFTPTGTVVGRFRLPLAFFAAGLYCLVGGLDIQRWMMPDEYDQQVGDDQREAGFNDARERQFSIQPVVCDGKSRIITGQGAFSSQRNYPAFVRDVPDGRLQNQWENSSPKLNEVADDCRIP